MAKPLPELPPLRLLDTVEDDEKKIETKVQGWIERVGEARARAAATLAAERTGSKTLPELLIEIFLRGKGARYITQADLAYARPDFAVFGSPGTPEGALILRCQGTFWHGNPAAIGRDAAQRDMLLNDTVQGVRVARVIDAWEQDIYEGDTVLDRAFYEGVEVPRGA